MKRIGCMIASQPGVIVLAQLPVVPTLPSPKETSSRLVHPEKCVWDGANKAPETSLSIHYSS